MAKGFIQETFNLIQKDFEVKSDSNLQKEEELLDILTPIIHHMLNRDFEKLLQICYRIDLGENQLKQILYKSEPELMARELSDAIIQRQKKKIEIRRKYSGS